MFHISYRNVLRVVCLTTWLTVVVQGAGDTVTADTLVQQALRIYDEEIVALNRRLDANIDIPVPNFKDLIPGILSANKAPLAREDIIRSSRIINRIGTYIQYINSAIPLSDTLKTSTAALHNVTCPFSGVSCALMPGRYRNYDGRCNNRINPMWGAAYTPFVRELEAMYESVAQAPGPYPRHDLPRRHGVDGAPLPSARRVSNVVHVTSHSPIGTKLTSLYTTFGQSLSHDLSDTPMEKGLGGANLGCCDQSIATDRCFSIEIPPGDFFSPRSCMAFVRSTETTDINCNRGVREQLNIASSFLDLTQVYGHNDEQAKLLRAENGLLQTSFPNNLPYQVHPNQKAFQQGINILLAGDQKTGEFPGLTNINALLLREHNRIATYLINRKWNSLKGPSFGGLPEEIYQTARRILIAVIQHVTYSEYLPVTIGPELMSKYGLYPIRHGHFQGYDPTVNPSTSNVFAAAAMRFGHSMVRNTYSLLDKNYVSDSSSLRLKNTFWRTNFYTKYEDGFQRGVLDDDSELCDRHIGEDLRNHMFETKPGNGLDLAALNIQRGRDHGLPPYNQYRRRMSLSPAKDWTTNPDTGFSHMTPEVVWKLQEVYSSPEDVDVWTGGVSETPVAGGQVGPLFAEMIARQFQRLRKGDFYWYENVFNGLTAVQLEEIRSYSLAKMICNNFPVDTIQPRAFQLHTQPRNARVSCGQLPDLNLSLW